MEEDVQGMGLINWLRTLPIHTDESMVDKDGNYKKEALIFENKIVVHPDFKEEYIEKLNIKT